MLTLNMVNTRLIASNSRSYAYNPRKQCILKLLVQWAFQLYKRHTSCKGGLPRFVLRPSIKISPRCTSQKKKIKMSHYRYPFRHSTYFTNIDHIWTSELPPMNSTEDIIQDMFMRDRSRQIIDAIPSVALLTLNPKGKRKVNNNPRKGLKGVVKLMKNWKRSSDTSFISFPKS